MQNVASLLFTLFAFSMGDWQVAGYVTTYDMNDFTFVTVKGSGHMVIWLEVMWKYMYCIQSDAKVALLIVFYLKNM